VLRPHAGAVRILSGTVGKRTVARTTQVVALSTEGDFPSVIAKIQSQGDNELSRLLASRREMIDESKYRHNAQLYRFFFRFDAWTLPSIWGNLTCPDFVNRLTPHDCSFYFDQIDLLAVPSGREVGTCSEWLYDQLVERAASVARGSDQCSPDIRPDESLATAITKIADFLELLFESEFPRMQQKAVPPWSPQLPDGPPSSKLTRSFAQFAIGDLAFKSAGSVEPLNAEPDTANFLILAEFSLRAAALVPNRFIYWSSLAQTFTTLIPWFLRKYRDRSAKRDSNNYKQAFRNEQLQIPLHVVLRELSSQRAPIPANSFQQALRVRAGFAYLDALLDEI